MKLTLLGVYGPFPAAGAGCSSYLIEDGDTKLLLDCGSGSLSRYRALMPGPLALDAIVLSHLHSDHSGEIDLFRYMLEFGFGKAPLKVLSPEVDRLRYPVFEPISVRDGTIERIGSLTLRFLAVRHAVPTVGVRITNEAGRSMFYTGDSALFDGLIDAARGADLLLADACLFDESNPKALQNHMTVAQVEQLRRDAGCSRAILTHRFGGAAEPIPLSDPLCFHAVEGAVYEI